MRARSVVTLSIASRSLWGAGSTPYRSNTSSIATKESLASCASVPSKSNATSDPASIEGGIQTAFTFVLVLRSFWQPRNSRFDLVVHRCRAGGVEPFEIRKDVSQPIVRDLPAFAVVDARPYQFDDLVEIGCGDSSARTVLEHAAA